MIKKFNDENKHIEKVIKRTISSLEQNKIFSCFVGGSFLSENLIR